MTLLMPDSINQKFTWKQVSKLCSRSDIQIIGSCEVFITLSVQMYVKQEAMENLGFRSFDLTSSKSVGVSNYPCRFSKCDQFCRDDDHQKVLVLTSYVIKVADAT